MNWIVREAEAGPELEDERFKFAMREVAGAVTILTAGRCDHISGMTVTSFGSLSADPPRVMVAVNRTASSYPLIERHGVFGASALGLSHSDIASRFASKRVMGAERFVGIDSVTLVTGVPLIANALAIFDCAVEEILIRHSHAIVIGRPLAVRVGDHNGPALAYLRGAYQPLGSIADGLGVS